MRFDIQAKISEYLELIEAIKDQVEDPATALAILPEIRKDMRAAEMRQSSSTFNSTGDLPATENQISFIRSLGGKMPEQGLTRNQASKVIEELEKIKKSSKEECFKAPVRRP
jgi:hypothetical protein